jgi:glycosyltransferase involved in cell wall biosynthesis
MLARVTCRSFKRLTCVSSRLEDTVKALGVPDERIDVMPAFRGIQQTSAHWVLSPRLEKWFEAHNPVFCSTASNRPEYGTELLVETIARLRLQQKNVGCLLIGLGEEAKEIRTLIEKRGLSESVLLLGDVPHDECLHILSRSAAFVRPTFTDGDSISVREALALGVPVIASDAASRPEGTVLFKTGNSADLMKQMEWVLERSLQDSAR